jgi:nitrite reductase/ring-hydroxylating ferredoxin subunit
MIGKMGENGQDSVEVAKLDDIPIGRARHVEINGKEIMIANIEGKYYALNDRCGHSSALLSMGHIHDNIVTCPLHAAQFDDCTGKKVREPKLDAGPDVENLPDDWKGYLNEVFKVLSCIKTYDQEKYEVEVDGEKVKVVIPK